MKLFKIFLLSERTINLLVCYGLLSVALVCGSCSPSEKPSHKKANNAGFFKSMLHSLGFTESPLTIPEYFVWLKAQKGVTYDQQENDKVYVSLLYKPLQLEAALSAFEENNAASDLTPFIDLKKGYHYFILEVIDKNTSLTENKESKEFITDQLKKNIYFIQNESDTIRNAIVEVFPGHIMHEPNKFLMLIPSDTACCRLRAGVTAESLGLADLKIDISENELKSFPKIKI